MRVLISCDKFKGSMTAAEACAAVARGLAADELEITQVPVADGGEGMAAAICAARGSACEWVEIEAQDPLGRPVTAGYAWIAEDRLAAVEMSQASGLWRVADDERDPWRASTFGTGQLIADALTRGARELVIGLGGSATNDGGRGMAEALGCDLEADVIATAPAIEAAGVRVTAACDVRNPLLGENGCTRIYGPQKGVAESDFERHEARLEDLVARVKNGAELAEFAGAGAAGGLGFACLAFLGADLKPGFQLVAEAVGLEAAMRDADLVITGEGSLDAQSLEGKAPAGVAAMARVLDKPVVAFAGVADEAARGLFDRVWEIRPPEIAVEESMARGSELLEAAARSAWFELRVLR